MLNGITSDVHLNNENGAVEIHFNKLGNMEVTNAQGDIRSSCQKNPASRWMRRRATAKSSQTSPS